MRGKSPAVLAGILVKRLEENGKTLATAESCTGGFLGKIITSISGASRVFKGGVITYSDEAKRKILKISSAVLAQKGAVSKETALQMALSVRRLFGSDLGLSITGISGPTGGSRKKPLGLTYIGISGPGKTKVFRLVFKGNREANRRSAVREALCILARHEAIYRR
jgi:nicotinamide-nucleotide amidase